MDHETIKSGHGFLSVSHVSNYSRDEGMQIGNIIGISMSVNTEISPDIYTEYNACIM